jgi:hypothetical protein
MGKGIEKVHIQDSSGRLGQTPYTLQQDSRVEIGQGDFRFGDVTHVFDMYDLEGLSVATPNVIDGGVRDHGLYPGLYSPQVSIVFMDLGEYLEKSVIEHGHGFHIVRAIALTYPV